MRHAQAFHTSCRTGLSGTSGFQINAASPQLDREQLAALSDAHARYETPHDLPYEPTSEQMREFPVALKMSVVPAVGPVVSRTEYVGREYRGNGEGPDEGRFGNYFCHMVVGAAGEDPFDGLNAVELWDAPHWTTTEAATLEIPELGPLSPGSIDLDEALATVAAAPPGVAAALVDGALNAVAGGPPVLIVDPVINRAVTWLAWITYALPPRVAGALTFSSFEGRPQDILDLHVVATTPACDIGPTVNSAFVRIDVTAPTTAASPTLYARAVTALAEQGSEALAGAVRKVVGDTVVEQGASLAVIGGVTDCATDDDLPGVLRQLVVLVRSDRVTEAAEAVAALAASEGGDRRAIGEWAELHLKARLSTVGDPARDVASAALGRLLAHLDALPDDLPAVPSTAPTAPDVGAIGTWLTMTEAARGGDESGRLVRLGVHLGLIGLNVPVDSRVAAVVAHDLEVPSMKAALDAIDADGRNDHVIKQITEAVLSEPAEEPRVRARLLALSGCEMARDTIRARAEELQTFDAQAAWQRTRIVRDPALRLDAARVLAEVAVDARDEVEIGQLWGEGGPQTEADLADLLRAYLDAGRPVPAAESDRGFRALMRVPLPTAVPPRTSIGYILGRLPSETRRRAEYYAWRASFDRPGPTTTLDEWTRCAVYALQGDQRQVPDERWEELLARVAEALIHERRDHGFADALAQFQSVQFDRLCEALGEALGRRVEAARDRATFAATEFEFWLRLPVREIEDLVLPTAFRRLSVRDVEDIGELLPDVVLPHWEAWSERNPRTGARAAVARAFGRRGKDREAKA
jgi:hypothetical protein